VYCQQFEDTAERQLSDSSGLNAQKTLIKLLHTEMAETAHLGAQLNI
jgi:hypothetical protein